MLQGLVERTRDPVKRRKYEAELEAPPMPIALLYLWALFWRLRRRKGFSDGQPDPIEWGDIDAFQRVTGQSMAPWEIETLEALDDLFRRPAPSKPIGE